MSNYDATMLFVMGILIGALIGYAIGCFVMTKANEGPAK